uniref:Uncharacterized protein n=1 Tax=Cajanus cajan TaxID=3821 RepID=A0A151QP83_CAJCA|nr:hypothetical protein KK1_047345 [Cajanus cajan]
MDEHQDSPLGFTQITAKKKVKGPTITKNVTSKRLHEERLHVDIDEITRKPTRDSAAQFISTMGVHARTKRRLSRTIFEQILWKLGTEDMRRKTLSIVAKRWRGI